jgi:hypothetical protein
VGYWEGGMLGALKSRQPGALQASAPGLGRGEGVKLRPIAAELGSAISNIHEQSNPTQ